MTDPKRDEARLRAAIEALRRTLVAASEAAHALEPADADEAGFDRVMQLGYLTDATAMLCGPRARVLSEVADALLGLEEPGELGEDHRVAH